MSDIPEITSLRQIGYPYDAILESPHGSLRRGNFRLLNGTPLRIVGRLRSDELLCLFATGGWVTVPEWWVKPQAGVYGDGLE